MPIKKRRLKITMELPTGQLVLDESLELHVIIHKDCLSMQSTADIDIVNMTVSNRVNLLTQFSAWNVRLAQTGVTKNPVYVNVKVEAGYDSDMALVFTGQVVETSLLSSPPSVGMRFHCASRQIDKTKDNTVPPAAGSTTFKQYVEWAAGQMGISQVVCETTHDNEITPNMFASIHDVSSLIWEIQSAYNPRVVAYIDNDILFVHEINVPLSSQTRIDLNEFIGIPVWTSYGATFTTLFDHRVKLGGIVHIHSSMNPSLGEAFDTWLVFSIDYELSSRREPFYGRVNCYPPAS
jgi:hypothetical protein